MLLSLLTISQQALKKFIADQLDVNVDELDINLVQDSSIGSGFVVRAGNHEYDWSEKARIEQLSEKLKSGLKDGLDPENMLSNLQSELENFTLNRADREVGVVISVADGTANVVGINHAFYGEIVIFDGGVKGMVLDTEEKTSVLSFLTAKLVLEKVVQL